MNIKLIYLAAAFSLILIACSAGKESYREGLDNNTQMIDTSRIYQEARNYVIEASNLQQRNKHAEAIIIFQQALKIDSSHAIAYFMAKSYKEIGKIGLALDYNSLSLSIKPDFMPALYLKAELYFLKFDLNKAEAALKRILELEDSRKAKLTLAKIYEFKDPDKAIRIYKDMLEEKYDESIMNNLAGLYNKLEMEDEYIDILVELFEKKPEQSTALQILSYYLDNKNFEKAINTLKLFETNTYGDRLAEIYEYTASYLLNDQDIIQNKTIAEYLDKIDSRFYTEWKLNFFSAMLADQINDSSKAESLYSRALKVNDDNPDIYLRYGFFYFSRENYPEADSIFTKGLDRFPEIILFPIYAASSKALSGDVETAEDWFDKAEAIDSTNVDLWIQKGIVYDNLEEYEKSDKAYSRALEIDPGNPLAANNYAYTLSLRGANLEKALRLIKAAIAVHPDNPSYLDTYAWVHYKLGNIDKAVKYIEKTVEKGGESAEVFEHMGDIYKEAGKIEKAAKAYQKALDIDPGLESVRNKLEEIR